MGFFGLFGKTGPTEKQIAKQVEHIKEQYAKPDYRQMAMDKLFSWGTKEALVGLLNRFKVVVQSPHWDEQEKRWLVDELVKREDAAKEVLINFVNNENEVTYPIRALSKLCSKKDLIDILKEALKKRTPEDYRTSEGKIELIAALEEYEIPDLSSLLTPYLDDHHDDIKCMAIDVLTEKKAADCYPNLLAILKQDYHSARVLRHAAAKISELDLYVNDTDELVPEVLEDFEIKSNKLVRRN